MSITLAPVLAIHNGQPTTTTKDVAEYFEKQHRNVLKLTRQRIEEAGAWGLLHFEHTPYIDLQNGQTYSMYRMTKNGFNFLVQKFTGRKAVQYQIAYIDEFDRMEAALRSPATLALLAPPKPAYMMEAWFALLKQQAQIMQRAALARAIKVSAPCLSQVLNGSGKYGNGQASTAKVAQRVACAFSIRLSQQSFTPLPTSQSTRAARRPERRRLGRGTPISAAAI